MKYEILLFDFDDTLYDFQYAEHEALNKTFADKGFTLTPEIKALYQKINNAFWVEFESGKITNTGTVGLRFQRLFDQIGLDWDGDEFNDAYLYNLRFFVKPIPGAPELIQKLHGTYRIYIVTNGLKQVQQPRFQQTDIKDCIEAVFISEVIGAAKPRKEYFDHVFANIPDFSKEKTLLIGDRLQSDIKGGVQAGIDTCWFNPGKTENLTEVQPTYEVGTMEELGMLLLK